MQLAHGIPSFEVGQPEPDEDVRATDDEDRQVEQVEEEGLARREGRHDEDRGDGEELQPSDHDARSVARWLKVGV